MSDAQITAADASGKYREQLSQVAPADARQTAMASGSAGGHRATT
jgi:hypothetical protein